MAWNMEKSLQHVERVAHRGGSHLAPENTLAAFRNALTLMVDAIELDVQMTRDGKAIVFHDNTVERLTNGKGNILDLDFAYLRSLNAAAHFPGGWPQEQQIPTLREVLDFAKGRLQVHVEIKSSKRDGVYGRYPQIAESVVNEIRAANMLNQVLVVSFDWSVLPLVRSLEPRIVTGMLVSNDIWPVQSDRGLETLLQQAQQLQVEWINMHYELFTHEMPRIFHDHNLKLGLWTVNTIDALQRFVHAGVDSLTTDRPDLFADLNV
jgi:glycerophosphoryl diester phosphodiesterase